jgi:hypothetical protein
MIKQRDVTRLKTEEMKFMRHTAKYRLSDYRRNKDTAVESAKIN